MNEDLWEIAAPVVHSEPAAGVGAFLALVTVFWIVKKIFDHPKVRPAYKIEGRDKKVKKCG